MAAASLEEVTPTTLVNCYKKPGFLMQDDDEQEDDLDDHPDDNNTAAMLLDWDTVGVEKVSLDDYISADDNVVVTVIPTDDIVASVQWTDSTSQLHPQDEFNDVDNCGEEFEPPTAEEAQYAIDIL